MFETRRTVLQDVHERADLPFLKRCLKLITAERQLKRRYVGGHPFAHDGTDHHRDGCQMKQAICAGEPEF